MASKTFFKVNAEIKKPTQKQIELVRRRALLSVRYGRKSGDKLDAKAVEAMLRMVSGRYSDLRSSLESEYRKIDHRLDAKFAQGVKVTKSTLIKIEQDIRRLESMGYDRKASGIDYDELLLRIKDVTKKGGKTK